MKESALILKYKPLAIKIASGYWGIDYHERYQEAMLGLVIAAKLYNPERGYFAPYARRIIVNRLNTIHNKKTLVLEELDAGNRIIFSNERYLVLKMDIERVVEALDIKSRKIVRLLIRGKNQDEIAEAIGMSQTFVSRKITKIREAVKEVL